MSARVLLLPDIPNWALDKGARDLVKYNRSSLELDIEYFDDFCRDPERFYREYDLIYPLYLGPFFYMQEKKMPMDKVVTGIRSFVRWDKNATTPPGYNTRPPGKVIRKLKRAVLVNTHSQKLWYLFSRHLPVLYTKYACDLEMFYPSAKPPGTKLVVGWTGSLDNHPEKRGFHDIIKPVCESLGVDLRVQAKEDRFITDDNAMRAFYQSLDVYVCASRVEGAGRPVLEAAACGIPVVSTDVGIVPELLENGHNGFVVDRTRDAFRERLAWLDKNREALPPLGAHIREKMEQEFNWVHVVHQWTDFLRYAVQLTQLKRDGYIS